MIGNGKRSTRDVRRGKAHELGEAPGVEVCRAERLANGVLPRAAKTAVIAWDMMRRDDTVAARKPREPAADLNDLAGDLVAEHYRRLGESVPFEDIAAADAGRHDAEDQLARACLRSLAMLDAQVPVPVIKRRPHG
jgi:hypothetical protein